MVFTYQGAPNKCFETRMALQQTDRTVTGDWIVTAPEGNNVRGDIAGTLTGVGVDTTFAGTVTWKTEVGTGTGACTGRSSFSGPSAPPQLEWSAPGDVHFTNCSDPGIRDVTWRLSSVPPTSSCR